MSDLDEVRGRMVAWIHSVTAYVDDRAEKIGWLDAYALAAVDKAQTILQKATFMPLGEHWNHYHKDRSCSPNCPACEFDALREKLGGRQ